MYSVDLQLVDFFFKLQSEYWHIKKIC